IFAAYAGARTVLEIRAALMRRTARLGFRYAALVCPGAGLALHNYPPAWVERLADGEPVDPMFDVAVGRSWPFFWRDPEVLAVLDGRRRAALRAASALGLADGFACSLRARSR